MQWSPRQRAGDEDEDDIDDVNDDDDDDDDVMEGDNTRRDVTADSDDDVSSSYLGITRPHRSDRWMRPIAIDGEAWSVCASVCLMVMFVCPAKQKVVMCNDFVALYSSRCN